MSEKTASKSNDQAVPSTLLLLTALPSQPAATKVRFLGCVNNYNIPTATLTLAHPYPPSSSSKDSENVGVEVSADISQVLDSIGGADLQVGAWVNVIGYVRGSPGFSDAAIAPSREGSVSEKKKKKKVRADSSSNLGGRDTETKETQVQVHVHVQAVVIWAAGPLKIEEYERAVEARMKNALD